MTGAAGNLLAGLSAVEARGRLEREGYNELPRERGFTLVRVVLGVIREPMFALLIAAALVYAIFGEMGESLLLLGFATASVSIAVIQRSRSERALQAL
ncbi:MAG TPA: cation-transporting P-type ATPase, partial [Steroidobacteraceae bacterium]|nr:cation-transporting P-type ATPase [Steroidobacteraceae bacterium]